MAKQKSEKYHCPNCGKQAAREGNEIICQDCDATFAIKKTGGAKVKRMGIFEDHEERISALEANREEPEPPEPPEPPAAKPVDEDEEEPIL